MAGKKRVRDAEVQAAKEIYKAAKQEAEAEIAHLKERAEVMAAYGEDVGVLKKIRMDESYNELIRVIVLFRCHQNKKYKEHGLTFPRLCEIAGRSDRWAYECFKDMRPFLENFSAFSADLLGMKINKIRYLGREVSAQNAEIRGGRLYYQGEEVEDPEELIDTLNKEREDLQGEVKAKDRMLRDRDKKISKLINEIERFEGTAAKRGLTPEEDAFTQQMENLRIGFDGYMLSVDPERMDMDGDATSLMRAEYLTTLWHLRTRTKAAYDTAVDMFGHDLIEGEEDWQPPKK